MFKIFAVFSLFFIGVYSVVCPKNVVTLSPFDASRYMGKWYELEKYPFFDNTQRCITAQYSLNTNGTMNVKNTRYVGNFALTTNGLATPNPSNPSNLTVSSGVFGSSGKYWLLDTDYDNYALVYSCTNTPLNFFTIENAWILGRNKQLSAIPSATIATLKKILSDLGSQTKKFVATQQDCTFDY